MSIGPRKPGSKEELTVEFYRNKEAKLLKDKREGTLCRTVGRGGKARGACMTQPGPKLQAHTGNERFDWNVSLWD